MSHGGRGGKRVQSRQTVIGKDNIGGKMRMVCKVILYILVFSSLIFLSFFSRKDQSKNVNSGTVFQLPAAREN